MRIGKLIIFGLTLSCLSCQTLFGIPVYYNHPRLLDYAHQLVREGSIERMNPDGTHTVVGGLIEPTGLAFDARDNLYFGNWTGGSMNLYKWEQDAGVLTALGQAWSQSGVVIPGGVWAGDVAVPEPASILLLAFGGLVFSRGHMKK